MKINNSFLKINLALICLMFCSTSFAGWELLQNSPTANDLHSVWFINDNTGWIAGYNNTIFKTTNSGESWVQQTSPVSSNFECITFVNENTGWTCGSGGTVIKTTNSGANWFSQTFTGVKFNSMDFLDANTGFICGDNGIIWRTINGGSNWVNQASGISQNLHEIKFINPDTGFAVGNDAYILRTINSGNSWDIKSGPGIGSQIFYSVGFNADLININWLYLAASGSLTKASNSVGNYWTLGDFPSEIIYSLSSKSNIVHGVGANGYIITIADGGAIYQDQSPASQDLFSVYFDDSNNTAWAAGANGTIIKYVTDWSLLPENYATSYGFDFINQNTGWVINNSNILKTTNSGHNWIEQITNSTLLDVKFINPNTGWGVGPGGKIIKTINGGNNWVQLNSNYNYVWYSVDFYDDNTGWVSGSGGVIIKTTDGGASWDSLTAGISLFFLKMKFVNVNTGWAAGWDGKIIKTVNGGQNWTVQNTVDNHNIYAIDFLDENTGWFMTSDIVFHISSVYKTTNGGLNWVYKNYLLTYDNISMDFLDSNLGYACGSIYINNHEGRVYKTTNGGGWWIEEDILVPHQPKAMEFIIENNNAVGFVVGDKILRTSFEYFGGEPIGNSGNYPGWVPVNSGTNQHIYGVDYINPFIAFAVGMRDPPGNGTGTILRTINGGQSWVRQQSVVNAEFGAVSFCRYK